ncbi:MAG: carbohydrate ABC transporter permease [Acutalibacteraceae bacterium]
MAKKEKVYKGRKIPFWGKENLTSIGMSAPYLLIFLTFNILPILIAICLSFTYFNMLQTPSFNGITNYINLLTNDDLFLTGLKNTIIMAVCIGPGGYLISLVIAWLINEMQGWLRTLMTFLFYAPSISGNVYFIWTVIFSSDSTGYANGILLNIGAITEPIRWFQNPKYMMTIVVIVAIWCSFGTGFLNFVAGFKGIDKQYYEAAMVDGVTNRWQELWNITLPIMRPQLLFGAVMSISNAFSVGAICTALCGFPSTQYAVHTIMNHLEDYGGARYEMGYACAIAVVLFLMIIGSNYLIRKMLAKVGE